MIRDTEISKILTMSGVVLEEVNEVGDVVEVVDGGHSVLLRV